MIGVDIVKISRFENKSEKFISRVYSKREIEELNLKNGQNKSEYLASRFASKEAYLKAAIAATIISTVSFLCFQLFPRQIIGIFGSESEAYFQFAEKFFRIFLFCTFINGLQPITANFFTAIGKASRGIFLSLTRQVIFLLPLMILLPIFMGIDGVMYSAPIADAIAAICAITFAAYELKSFSKK